MYTHMHSRMHTNLYVYVNTSLNSFFTYVCTYTHGIVLRNNIVIRKLYFITIVLCPLIGCEEGPHELLGDFYSKNSKLLIKDAIH